MKTPINYYKNLVRLAAAAFCIVAGLICVTFFAYGQDKQPSSKPRANLTFSNDGKFLIDSSGKKVEQYLESAKAFVPMTAKDKKGAEFNPADSNKSFGDCHPHPCNCGRECIRWDENGNCNGWAQHCDICC
jgi:hypothetical protein